MTIEKTFLTTNSKRRQQQKQQLKEFKLHEKKKKRNNKKESQEINNVKNIEHNNENCNDISYDNIILRLVNDEMKRTKNFVTKTTKQLGEMM